MDKQRLIENRIFAQHALIAQRLRESPTPVLAHARQNLARWSRKYSRQQIPKWLKEWERLLAGPIEDLLRVLNSDSERARRLRASSPFAGIVSARARWAIYRDISDEA
ncbi:MAG: hypothetical protein DRQ37_05205 [Gammaproteobacteria bacterium]|nr:MAG: hypothetical protein DRQ37_05205 [Gammaproteobacteria bacterium]